MSYKPDEAAVMAYLYGELDGAEREKVTAYFQEHPEALADVQEFAEVRKIMDFVQDKEVIAPPVFAEQPGIISFWRSTAFKTVASIAAAVMLLLIAGKAIGPDIQYSNGELRIAFGKAAVSPSEAPLSAQAVQQMIDQSVAGSTRALAASWTENQEKINASVRKSLDGNSRKVDDLMKNTSAASQDQLRTYVASLQKDNLKLMKEYLQLSSKEQNNYVENLLIGFSKYMQEQRAQDLVLVQNKVNDLQKNSSQFQQETEQLLASIISSAKPVQKNY